MKPLKKKLIKVARHAVKDRVLDLEARANELSKQLHLQDNLIAQLGRKVALQDNLITLKRQANVQLAQELRLVRGFLQKAGTE